MSAERIVIKLGGSLLDDAERRASVLRSVVGRWSAGEDVILVHGGGRHIDAALARAGIAKRTHAGLRVTDAATLEIVVAVLAGTVNKMLVGELTAAGARAAGVSGCDGGTLVAAPHPPIDGVNLGAVGLVKHSNRALLVAMLSYGILPVVSSVAQGPAGTLLNVNADAAAAAIAIAHGARELVFLTDVDGLLDEHGQVVGALDPAGLSAMLESPAVHGGMRPKLQAAHSALQGGVARVTIGAPAPDDRRLTTGGTCLVAA